MKVYLPHLLLWKRAMLFCSDVKSRWAEEDAGRYLFSFSNWSMSGTGGVVAAEMVDGQCASVRVGGWASGRVGEGVRLTLVGSR